MHGILSGSFLQLFSRLATPTGWRESLLSWLFSENFLAKTLFCGALFSYSNEWLSLLDSN